MLFPCLIVLIQLNLSFDTVPVIVGTLDGTVYALDDNTGETIWEVSSGGNLIEFAGHVHIVPSLDGKLFHLTQFGILEVYLR